MATKKVETPLYQLTSDADVIVRLSDSAIIPKGHRWYDEYLAWKEQGNEPLAVVVPEVQAPSLTDLQTQLMAIQEQIAALASAQEVI